MPDMFMDNNGKVSFFRIMGFIFGLVGVVTIICSLIMAFMKLDTAMAFGGFGFGIIPLILGTKALQKKFEVK